MKDPTRALDERTRSALWPERWMTLAEMASELDDQDFWHAAGFAAWSAEGRLHWLRDALKGRDAAGRKLWLRMGARFKNFALVRQNRADIEDYLTWAAEARAARTRSAEALLEGEVITSATLHPLAEPEECRAAVDRLTNDVIEAVPDAEIAGKLRSIWAIYEDARPVDAVIGLRVCRLFCAMGTLVVEYCQARDTGSLRRAVETAEAWLSARLCSPVPDEDEITALAQ